MDNTNSNLESSSGIQYRIITLIISIVLVLAFVVPGLVSLTYFNQSEEEWSYYFIIAGNIMVCGAIAFVLFPNTKKIILKETHIEIIRKKKVIKKIPYKKISNIYPYSRFLNEWFSTHEFYIIEYLDDYKKRNEVCFKCRLFLGQNDNPSFGKRLYSKWLQRNNI